MMTQSERPDLSMVAIELLYIFELGVVLVRSVEGIRVYKHTLSPSQYFSNLSLLVVQK